MAIPRKPSTLIKPTLDTKFNVDYSWWGRNAEDLRTYLLSHVLPEQRERISQSEEHRVVDFIDPETGETVLLYNPRIQIWQEHFVWSEDSLILIGLSAIGRATVKRLNMNKERLVKARRRWVAAGWHPPK